MKRTQFLRVLTLLLVIFAAGLAIGRLSARKAPTTVHTLDGREVTTASQLDTLTRELGLARSQVAEFQPIIEQAVEQMSQLPAGSPERIPIFRETVTKLRTRLRPEQQAVLDRLVQEAEQRHRQTLRGKAGGRRS